MLILKLYFNKKGWHNQMRIYKQPLTKNNNTGFTIVELLVVIVIIGILAAITIVSYTGITNKANTASVTSDLANAKKQFALYYANHEVYPTGLDANKCPTNASVTPTDTNYCLKPSSGTSLNLYPDANGAAYGLRATRGSQIYSITNTNGPAPTVAIDSNWITIGSQTWAKANLNVGTRVASSTASTNNGTIEKYCYGDLDANCTATSGALYDWNEAMAWSTTEGAQGICPAGSHIPTDNEWKTLEMHLGMTKSDADAMLMTNRGAAQTVGTKLKVGGTSGMEIAYTGLWDGSAYIQQAGMSDLWTSSRDVNYPWYRIFSTVGAGNGRFAGAGTKYHSLRCLAN